jgi:hypothetical protein
MEELERLQRVDRRLEEFVGKLRALLDAADGVGTSG